MLYIVHVNYSRIDKISEQITQACSFSGLEEVF